MDLNISLSTWPEVNHSSLPENTTAAHGYTHQASARICLLGGLIIFSVIGNSLVMYNLMLGRDSLGKKRSKTIFLNITLADVLVTMFPMAGQLIWEILDREWLAGLVFCKLFKFFQTFALASSNYMLVALAMDRHRAVTKPLTVTGSPYRLISTAWMTSLIPSIPCFFIFEITMKTLTNNSLAEPIVWEECTSNFSGWPKSLKKAYFTAVFLIIFVIPLAIMFCLYTHILLQLRDKARDNKRARLLEMGEQKQATTYRTSIRVNLPRGVDKSYLSRAKVKTTNLSLTVVTIYIITNLPYMVDEFIRQEILADSWCTMSWCGAVEAIIGVSMVSNSAINPFIFLLFKSSSPTASSIARNYCPSSWTSQNRSSLMSVSFRKNTNCEENGRNVFNLACD